MANEIEKINLKLKPFVEATGYQPKTTFWTDFSLAEPFGTLSVIDTYKRAFEEWKNNVEYLTELVMILNWKIWQHGDTPLGHVYNDLWADADSYCMDNMKGDDLSYFINTTD